ncbi:hypothetical protein [Bradyrhizobium sp. AUGA SZCCT0182]|uniref:hypothetical protein n=1 Tax=Bradyrhizobium sp. AUGA SZCCT0182 TaxID=2807667 RepID=UPI001BAD71F2|nr:hypothetical protein [Bradyrhizobium sp. AUGA SZCCT0182]MBR1238417.1 hypothetical protein [Bradyrhizobium sp. AUGA SZCCT0182]
MIEEKFARLRTHRNNIDRYRRLLKTELTELERRFIERRLSEEQTAMDELAASTFPVRFNQPMLAGASMAPPAGEACHV